MACSSFRILSVVLGLAACSCSIAADLEVIYTTRAGDTLIGLEKQFLASPFGWKGLRTHNRIGSPMRMPVGTPLADPRKLAARRAPDSPGSGPAG